MIIEAALAISLSSGADLGTTRLGLNKGFKESNPLVGPTLGRQLLYTGAYTALGTASTNLVNKKWGKKPALAVLGIFCAVPIGAAIHNGVKIW